jgi:predicted nucleic acid-binding protein
MVAALRSDRGSSRRLLVAALESKYRVLLSVPLMFEYEAILTRQKHLDAARSTREDVGAILDALGSRIEPVLLAFLWRPTLPDPADDMVLETAVNGGADLLVTLNLKHFQKAASRFEIEIVSPVEAVRLLGFNT